MKVASNQQSLILANARSALRTSGSVFDAALGPAARRATPQRLTIVASAADRVLVDDSSESSTDSEQLSEAAAETAPSSSDLTIRAEPPSALRQGLTDGVRYRNPVELYAQTQRILSDSGSPRSVYLDVHA